MENLDFGWEFGVMVLIIMGFIYFLMAFANYSIMLLLTMTTKTLVKAILRKNEKLSVLHIMAIYLPIILITQFAIARIAMNLITNDRGQISYHGTETFIFWEIYFFYANNWFLLSFELLYLLLIRYVYNIDGTIIERVKWKRRIINIWLFMLAILVFREIENIFFNYFYIQNVVLYWLIIIIQIIIYGVMAYLIIKKEIKKIDNL